MIIMLSSIILSCENEFIQAPPIDPQFEYANLGVGRTWEYKYDSINYLNGGVNKRSNKGFIQILVQEEIEKNKFRILKSIKKDSLGKYTPFRAEIIQIQNNILTTTDNNLTFINLVFPPKLNSKWAGNRLFNEQVEIMINDEIMKVYNGWEYNITRIDSSISIVNKIYPNTLEVVAGPINENLISRRQRREYYTKGVGLTKVQMEVLNTQKIQPNVAWKDKAESGFIYIQELVSVK
jgi:hypothetical protein